MRLLAQTILLLSTGYLPVAYAFLKLQAITGDDVEHGCSQEQLSHLIESVRQASEAAHNTGSTLLSARDHSFPAVEILLGGQHYEDPSMKKTFTVAVTKHVVNVAVVLGETLGTASEFSLHQDTLNFACPLEQERTIVVGSGPSGIRNVLKIGPSFFTLSAKSTADQDAYDAAKNASRNSRIFAQMPAFTSAPFHILRAMSQAMLGMPVRATPLSLGRLAGSGLEADGCASVCILYQLDKQPFAPCEPVGVVFTREELPTCPSMAMGMLRPQTSRVRRTTPGSPPDGQLNRKKKNFWKLPGMKLPSPQGYVSLGDSDSPQGSAVHTIPRQGSEPDRQSKPKKSLLKVLGSKWPFQKPKGDFVPAVHPIAPDPEPPKLVPRPAKLPFGP